jgi:hypothetical protein
MGWALQELLHLLNHDSGLVIACMIGLPLYLATMGVLIEETKKNDLRKK